MSASVARIEERLLPVASAAPRPAVEKAPVDGQGAGFSEVLDKRQRAADESAPRPPKDESPAKPRPRSTSMPRNARQAAAPDRAPSAAPPEAMAFLAPPEKTAAAEESVEAAPVAAEETAPPEAIAAAALLAMVTQEGDPLRTAAPLLKSAAAEAAPTSPPMSPSIKSVASLPTLEQMALPKRSDEVPQRGVSAPPPASGIIRATQSKVPSARGKEAEPPVDFSSEPPAKPAVRLAPKAAPVPRQVNPEERAGDEFEAIIATSSPSTKAASRGDAPAPSSAAPLVAAPVEPPAPAVVAPAPVVPMMAPSEPAAPEIARPEVVRPNVPATLPPEVSELHGAFQRTQAKVVVGEGPERVELHVSADRHRVQVEAHVADEQTASDFRNGSAELRQALRQHGLELTDLATGSGERHGFRDREGRPEQPAGRGTSGPRSEEAQPPTKEAPRPGQGVRVIA